MRILLVLLMVFGFANTAFARGDASIGQSAAIICIGCHGIDGNSNNPIYPRLAAQGDGYLAKQLRDFKSGARKEEHMTSMVEAVELQDVEHIAVYFASQMRKPAEAKSLKTGVGKEIFLRGIQEKGVSACASCHGKDGRGNPSKNYPSLAGQHADYLVKALKDFRDGARSNDPDKLMRNITAHLTDTEINAVANYASHLR